MFAIVLLSALLPIILAITVLVGFIIRVAARVMPRVFRNDDRTSDWRLGSHRPLRRSVVRKILDMLRAKHPGPDPERRLPRIAKSLEYRLFRKAVSIQEYQDETTLKPRLRTIVREVYEAAGRPLPATDAEMAPVAPDNRGVNSVHGEPEIDPEQEPLVGSNRTTFAMPQEVETSHVLEIETAVALDL